MEDLLGVGNRDLGWHGGNGIEICGGFGKNEIGDGVGFGGFEDGEMGG